MSQIKWIFLLSILLVQGQALSAEYPLAGIPENTSTQAPDPNGLPEALARTPFGQIHRLRMRGELDEARDLAISYLKNHPDDVDVILELGLVYYQKQQYQKAEVQLEAVLRKTPKYLDARLTLVRIKIAEKQFAKASDLIEAGLTQSPDAELYELKKQLQIAQQELEPLPVMHEELPLPSVLVSIIPKELEPVAVMPKEVPLPSVLVSKTPNTLERIKTLRSKGSLVLATKTALEHLKTHPEDIDILVQLGLLEFQQSHYKQAIIHLKEVLAQAPGYLDARLGLIKANIALHQYQESASLTRDGLIQHPQDSDLLALKKEVQALQYPAKPLALTRVSSVTSIPETQNNELTRRLYRLQLDKNPLDVDARLKLADLYLRKSDDTSALQLIQQGLALLPNNILLLLKKAEIAMIFKRYGMVAQISQMVLKHDPENKQALGRLSEIDDISPRYRYGINELGFYSDNAYVSDLHKIWSYSSLFYNRETDYGLIGGKINYAARLGYKAPQYEINYAPQYNRSIRAELVAAYSQQNALFPRYLIGAEGYMVAAQSTEVSIGGRYSNIGPTYFSTYTGSFNVYPDHYWISFRPYFYVPKDTEKKSLLYTGIIRRYFSTVDHFVSLGAGIGQTPDLADLLTVNFIVIKNTYVNLTYEVPLIRHQLALDLSIGYQRWLYPSGQLRQLYNGSVSLKYRF